MFWERQLSRISDYLTIPDCNVPCRFTNKPTEGKYWFEFLLDSVSWSLPPKHPMVRALPHTHRALTYLSAIAETREHTPRDGGVEC